MAESVSQEASIPRGFVSTQADPRVAQASSTACKPVDSGSHARLCCSVLGSPPLDANGCPGDVVLGSIAEEVVVDVAAIDCADQTCLALQPDTATVARSIVVKIGRVASRRSGVVKGDRAALAEDLPPESREVLSSTKAEPFNVSEPS